MDLVKVWQSILAANVLYRNMNPRLCYLQGANYLALAGAARSDAPEAESEKCPDEGAEDEDPEDERRSVTPSSTSTQCRRRVQRMRYSREEYKCQACAYACTTERAFFRHLRQDCGDGGGGPRISCPICGKDRATESTLLAHMTKHRAGKHFCCDLCKFRTLQMKKLIQHRRMHTGEKPHLCPFCTYRSARRDNLRSHVRRVHKKDNLTCDTFAPRTMLLSAGSAAADAGAA